MLAGHIKDQAAYLDKNISYQIYSLGRRYQKQTRKYLKGLEYSCHGIPWLTLTTLLCYINSSNTSYVHLLIGLIFDIIYVAVAKASFRRRRPTYASQEDQMIMIGYDKLSFPSGHTSRAIYVALFYSGYWYSLFIWIWALAVSGSRVVYGRHFVGDLVGGLVVGYFNYVTQFTLFYPIHAMMEWFINSLLMETAGGD